MIVDDHDIVLRGVSNFLRTIEDHVTIVTASSGAEALKKAAEFCPDVVLMDILMPQMDGIETTIRLLEICPQAKVIALSAVIDRGRIQAMIHAGAVGYLTKTAPIDNIIHVIRATHAGHMTFAPELSAILLDPIMRNPNPYDLTKREYDVLKLITQGYSNPQIAESLNVSRSTVGYHVSSLLAKLNVHNRMEAAKLAVKERIVSEPDSS